MASSSSGMFGSASAAVASSLGGSAPAELMATILEPQDGGLIWAGGGTDERESARPALRSLLRTAAAADRRRTPTAPRRDDHRRQPALGPRARARDGGARSSGRRREDARVPRLVRCAGHPGRYHLPAFC